jgi:hypothetical protein
LKIGTFYSSPRDPRCLFKSSRRNVLWPRMLVRFASPQSLLSMFARAKGRRLTCFVMLESPYLQTQSILNSLHSSSNAQANLVQMPVLTTFIPSLTPNSPFRVSIHSWDKPRPTRIMEALMQPDDSVLYGARIFIDGLCVSYVIYLDHFRDGKFVHSNNRPEGAFSVKGLRGRM